MPRLTLQIWWRAMRRRHVRAFFAYPHHYAVAVGLTALLIATGHAVEAAAAGAFGYAILENLCADLTRAAEEEAERDEQAASFTTLDHTPQPEPILADDTITESALWADQENTEL